MLKNLSHRGWVILAGVVFAIAGLFVCLLLLGSQEVDLPAFYILFMLAWGIAGAVVWWFLLRRGAVIQVLNGIAAGVIASLIAHPLIWLMFTVLALFTNIEKQTLGDPLHGLSALLFWPIATLVSWLMFGWITALVGGAFGGILGFLNRRSQVDMSEKPALNRVLRIAGTVLSVFAVLLLLMGVVPAPTDGFESKPQPAADYAGGMAKLEAIRQKELADPLLDECRTQWRTHDQRTAKVVVFYHGLTNCPEQFRPLGDVFFERGYNVIIARHPYHVYQDRDVGHLAALTPFAYRDMADAALDAAQGLGEQVYVVGLSGGGTVAAWAAQYRTGVTRSVMLAPFYGSGFMPPIINRFGVNLLTRIPNITLPGTTVIPYAYPGNTTRAMGETMRLGEGVRRLATGNKPASSNVALLINENDKTVNNRMALELMDAWEDHGVTPEIYVMPKALGLPHDIIDVHQEVKDTEMVYTAVVDIVEGRQPTFK